MNTRAVAVLAACLWAWPAQATCDLEVAEFGGATGAVRRALTEDDLGTAARIVDDLERRYPCLTFAPARQAWAQWQSLVAVTRFAQGDRDQADLLARYAVSLDPLLDRSWLGSGHELRAVGARVPEGAPVQVRYPKPLRKRATLYVDGEPSAVGVPSDDLPHRVQLNDGVWWDSRFVERGAPHSARRLWVPRLAPPTVDVWADVGLRAHRQGGLFDSTDPDESFRRSPFWLGAVVLSGELKWRRALSAWESSTSGAGETAGRTS